MQLIWSTNNNRNPPLVYANGGFFLWGTVAIVNNVYKSNASDSHSL